MRNLYNNMARKTAGVRKKLSRIAGSIVDQYG